MAGPTAANAATAPAPSRSFFMDLSPVAERHPALESRPPNKAATWFFIARNPGENCDLSATLQEIRPHGNLRRLPATCAAQAQRKARAAGPGCTSFAYRGRLVLGDHRAAEPVIQ